MLADWGQVPRAVGRTSVGLAWRQTPVQPKKNRLAVEAAGAKGGACNGGSDGLVDWACRSHAEAQEWSVPPVSCVGSPRPGVLWKTPLFLAYVAFLPLAW